jgi:hypothetical protein
MKVREYKLSITAIHSDQSKYEFTLSTSLHIIWKVTDEPLRNLDKSTHLTARLNAEVDGAWRKLEGK